MFGNFTNEDRLYKEIRSMKKVIFKTFYSFNYFKKLLFYFKLNIFIFCQIRDVLKECIENYNSVNKKKIDIILFEDALSNI